ncbi:MAG TPA: hypothetical protein PKJ37_10955 [Acidobacteriota bacterium]|nr:hypothetical protein [Acidobacteriota bacterium]HNT18394.1 hypothetical protein [Acidobacteriota bacterium]
MKTRIILAVAVVLILAIALTSGASNMGFKLSQTLSATVAKYVALPFYNSYSTQTAAFLRNDIIAAGGTGVNVYNWNGTAWQRYAGGGVGQVNFALAAGDGYQVVSTADVSNWVIVGSHNPSTTITMSATVAKYVAVPYHSTSTSAALLRNEIIAAGGTGVNVYNWNGTAWQRYAGGGVGQVNFALTPGLAYQCVSTAAVGSWTPAHY